ncbi:MurR/RpiR family transcriptional regulator [Microtetraspora malaysiensis]|uniref:MurR/RpiR family transcriptional regulator n=1 Tax=Microtetraspora malaysiensis TaxID=161358 RepID=UPI003D94B7FC
MIVGRIQAELDHLPEALRRIGQTILADPGAATRDTSPALAERSGTSPAAVTRFCRQFGFAGFAELRVALATETGRAEQAKWDVAVGHEIGPDDPVANVIQSVAAADTRLIQETAAQLEADTVAAVADAIVAAGRVMLFGSSSSGLVAQFIGGHMRRIGLSCWAHADPHEALADAAMLRPGDVVIGVSHQGRTSEVLEIVGEAGDHGATTVAVTSFPRSPLATLADHTLITGSREVALRPVSLSAVHSQMFVLDTLFVAVAQRTYERTNEAFRRTIQALEGHRVERN